MTKENAHSLIQSYVSEQKIENQVLFALSLFCRWILRSIASISLPLPGITKSQIYSATSRGSLPVLGTDDPGPIVQWVSSQEPVALVVLQALTDCKLDLKFQPSPEAFSLDENTVVCSNQDGWTELVGGQWLTNLHFDLAQYHLWKEDYAATSTCLNNIPRQSAPLDNKLDMNILNGLRQAIGGNEKGTSFGPGQFDVKYVITNPQLPLYWRINCELAALYEQKKEGNELVAANVEHRIKASQPSMSNPSTTGPSSSQFTSSLDLKKSKMMNALLAMETPKLWSGKVTITSKLQEPKTKVTRIKRRNLISAVLRESKPAKLQKAVHDLEKHPISLRMLSNKWSLDDQFFAGYAALISGRGKDAEIGFVYLNKLFQLLKTGFVDEASAMFRRLEGFELETTRGNVTPAFKALQFHSFSMRIETALAKGQGVSVEDQNRCRQFMLELPNLNIEMYEVALENCLAVLINHQVWDAIFAIQEPRWKTIQFCQIVLSLSLFINGGNINIDVKKSCLHLTDLLQHMLQPISGGAGKRSRDGLSNRINCFYLTRLIKKIRRPEFFVVLHSIFATLYNELAEDSANAISQHFPSLPVTSASLPQSIHADHFLTLLGQISQQVCEMINNDPTWNRIRGEVLFAEGNHVAGLKHFILSQIMLTNFFSKPLPLPNEIEDKVTHKVIKCLSELGYNSYSAVASQLLSDVDYSICFKSLEERRSNDAMDGVYETMWDTTVLEYAVSMHTKRGDHARRRAAIHKIGCLEVNTNNNIEILREAAGYRKADFYRVISKNFL